MRIMWGVSEGEQILKYDEGDLKIDLKLCWILDGNYWSFTLPEEGVEED